MSNILLTNIILDISFAIIIIFFGVNFEIRWKNIIVTILIAAALVFLFSYGCQKAGEIHKDIQEKYQDRIEVHEKRYQISYTI